MTGSLPVPAGNPLELDPGADVHGCESCIQRSVYRLQPVAAETSKSTQLNPV